MFMDEKSMDVMSGGLPGMPISEAGGIVKHGESTGAFFERTRRADADSMCELWVEDPRKYSMRKLSEQFGCSQNTVRAVLRGRGLLSVDAVAARVREVMDAGLLGLATRVADDVDAVPNSQVPMLLDVLARNRQLLAGGPTEIVESREVVVNVDAWNEQLRAARAISPRHERVHVDEGSVIEAVLVGKERDGEIDTAVSKDCEIGLRGEKMEALRGPEEGGDGAVAEGADRGVE